ncbi:MAG: prephenate dehydrogenase [Vicinamibacterales bacterium]
MSTQPLTLVVVGLGLIGTSVALAARRRWPSLRIAGVDHPEKLLNHIVAGVCDLASPDLSVVTDADVIILATPVATILNTVTDIVRLRSARTLVTDVGSTKRAIVAAFRKAGCETFVGGHPIAGGEIGGALAARADLFDGRPWLLIGTGDTPLDARAEALIRDLGALPVWTDAETHDRVMAAVSHLPQVVASALMVTAADAAGAGGLSWAGSGLRDTTRLAGSASSLWESVLATNSDELQPLLLRLSEELRLMADHLAEPTAVRRLFDAANLSRGALEASRSDAIDKPKVTDVT